MEPELSKHMLQMFDGPVLTLTLDQCVQPPLISAGRAPGFSNQVIVICFWYLGLCQVEQVVEIVIVDFFAQVVLCVLQDVSHIFTLSTEIVLKYISTRFILYQVFLRIYG